MQAAFMYCLTPKQPAARIQQILEILDSDVIVTSQKYEKDLEKLEFKGKVLIHRGTGSGRRGSVCAEQYSRTGMWIQIPSMEFLPPALQEFRRVL